MPYTDTDFAPLQEASNSGTGTSVAVSLPGGTTEGMTVLIFIYAPSSSVSAIPSGFSSNSNGNYIRSNVAASETGPWTFTLSISTTWVYHVMEVDNLDLTDPYDLTVANTAGTTANGATRSTGTSAATAGSESVAYAYYMVNKAGAGDVQSWGSWTNGFVEQLDWAPAGTGYQIAVARQYVSNFATTETTATLSTTAGSVPAAAARIAVYRAAGSAINAPLAYLTGFEFGTHGGLANSGAAAAAGSPLGASATGTGTVGTNFIVQSSSARNGGYGLRLVASASTPGVDFANFGTANRFVMAFNIRPVSATGTPVMATVVASGADVELVYDPATEKFGLRWVGGSESWQTGTTPLNTWAWVEIRVLTNSATYHTDWWIETGTGDGHQTSPTDVSGTLGSSLKAFLGCLANATFTADYDDLVMTRHSAAYPLGSHQVRLLVPETTGASVSGTSGNFSKFTSNGTLAAWASDAGALLDEVPPTVSASSDGVVQTAVAASDYMNFPMTTYTLAADEIIAGVRALASLWGGTGTGTGTLGFRGYDGTAEATFVAASTSFDPDSLTAVSATYPLWYQGMWNPGAKWTQAMLDAAALRLGFSTDATPDMGASALYLEVATRTVRYWTAFRLPDEVDPDEDAAVVEEGLHPYSSGTRLYRITNSDPTRSCVFSFFESGGEHALSPVTVGPGDPVEEIVIGAEDYGTIVSKTFAWVV